VGILVSKKGLADLLGKSPKHISNLIDDGLPVEGGGGRGKAVEIDSESAINFLIRREIAKRLGDEEDDGSNQADADLELKRVRKEKIELEIDIKKRGLLPFDAVESILFLIANVYATQLDSLASRVASDMAVLDDPAEIRQLLFKECRGIREATADRLGTEIQKLTQEIDEITISDAIYGDSSTAEE